MRERKIKKKLPERESSEGQFPHDRRHIDQVLFSLFHEHLPNPERYGNESVGL